MPKFIFKSLLTLIIFAAFVPAQAQDSTEYQILDEVIAVVGGEIVIASELKEQIVQYGEQYGVTGEPCVVFEQLLNQKLLLHNARVDSVEISDGQVESEMDRRMRYFIQQIGSKKALEEFYGKSIVQLKEEFRTLIREQLLVQGLQQEITGSIKITPAEVEDFYNKIPEDSLPLVNSQVELAQIVVFPEVSPKAKQKARKKLEGIRKDILGGKDFATQAVLYSEDPGSAAKGGDLGMAEKGTFVPEFDAVALSLRDGDLSNVFETQFGYHLMQMLERRGEKYQARHILIKAKIGPAQLKKAKSKIDSLYNILENDPKADFAALATENSDDENTANSGGVMMNTNSGSPRFDMGELNGQLFLEIDNLAKGGISAPAKFTSLDGKEGYRIIKLLERTAPHKANLKDDYQILQEAAASELKAAALEDYIKRKLSSTYVKLNPEHSDCNFRYNWNKAQ